MYEYPFFCRLTKTFLNDDAPPHHLRALSPLNPCQLSRSSYIYYLNLCQLSRSPQFSLIISVETLTHLMFPYLALHNTLTVPYLPSLELCQLPRSPNLPYQSLSTLPLTLSSLSKSMPTLAHSLSFSLSISLNSFARLRFPSRSLSTISRSRYLYDAKLVAVATKS